MTNKTVHYLEGNVVRSIYDAKTSKGLLDINALGGGIKFDSKSSLSPGTYIGRAKEIDSLSIYVDINGDGKSDKSYHFGKDGGILIESANTRFTIKDAALNYKVREEVRNAFADGTVTPLESEKIASMLPEARKGIDAKYVPSAKSSITMDDVVDIVKRQYGAGPAHKLLGDDKVEPSAPLHINGATKKNPAFQPL